MRGCAVPGERTTGIIPAAEIDLLEELGLRFLPFHLVIITQTLHVVKGGKVVKVRIRTGDLLSFVDNWDPL